MSASCFGEPKRDELPAASSITCRLDAAVLRSSACPCPLPCRCAWISATIASAMLVGSRPPSSRPTGACRRAPNFAAVAAPRSDQQALATRRGAEQSDVRNRGGGQCRECREVGREVMAHDHGGIEPREIQVLRQLRRSGQQHPSCPRKSHRVGVGWPMVRHRHAPTQRGAEFHHRQCVRTAADQQQFAWDRHGVKKQAHSGTVELDDPAGRRARGVPGLCCQPGGQLFRQSGRRSRTASNPERRTDGRGRCRRIEHEGIHCAFTLFETPRQGGEGFPVRRGIEPDEPDVHAALATGAQSPQQIVVPAIVVPDHFWSARMEHRRRVRGQVALETAARKDALVPTAGADQHLCPRLAVGRAAGGNDRREHERSLLRARPFVHRQQLMQ